MSDDFGIDVYCDRHHDRAQVDVLTRRDGVWASAKGHFIFLAGDVPLTPAGRAQWAGVEALRPGAIRRVYTGTCSKCSPPRRVTRRWEKLTPKLDAVAEHGVSELSLDGLGSMLS